MPPKKKPTETKTATADTSEDSRGAVKRKCIVPRDSAGEPEFIRGGIIVP